MKQNAEKFLMFGFDMETDVGSTSHNYKGVEFGTPAIVDVLQRNKVNATFLFTGDCALKNKKSVELVDSKGYEIGCHSLFHEDLGQANFNSSSASPILDEELEHRLKINVDIVKNITHKDPLSFRSPRGFGSNKLIEVLEKLGFESDSSYIQSIQIERDFPYFAAKENWREPGRSKILELPIFAFDLENAADNSYQLKLDQWPRIRTHGAEFVYKNMQPVVERQIKTNGYSALTFYMHPWEFYPMPTSIKYAEGTLYYDEFLYKNTGDVQIKELDKFIGMCLEGGFNIVDFKTFRKIFCERSKS